MAEISGKQYGFWKGDQAQEIRPEMVDDQKPKYGFWKGNQAQEARSEMMDGQRPKYGLLFGKQDSLMMESTDSQNLNESHQYNEASLNTPLMPAREVENLPAILKNNQCLPAEPNNQLECMAREAKIYRPDKSDNTAYQKKVWTAQELKEEFCRMYTVRNYDGDTYVYSVRLGVYLKGEKDDLQSLIYSYLSEHHVESCHTNIITQIATFIKLDPKLRCQSPQTTITWVCENGYLDGQYRLQKNYGDQFIISFLRCRYIPQAVCPHFDEYIHALTAGDKKLENRIMEMIGYILSTDCRAKVFFTLYGPKDTGKSLFANLISAFFGKEDVFTLSIHDFGRQFGLSRLKGKRLNKCMDLTSSEVPDKGVAILKGLTGGDEVYADVKFSDGVQFYNTAKIILGTNHRIRIVGEDQAFFDRQIEIPIFQAIPKDKQNKDLLDVLVEEKPGILLRAMQGYERLKSNNYIFTEISLPELPSGYEYDNKKIIDDFILNCCKIETGAKIFTEDLYAVYSNYAAKKRVEVLSKAEFSRILNNIVGKSVTRKKVRIDNRILQGYEGICLR